ncbi:hypothetical protein [Butyrivibrio sp. INlla16]|uniref:IS1096 element passenger TnpR family protein n=1 Tax=Butyrivibrio sp. INlla16 TaxID=1520807 RepID=UPI00088C8C5C|nr:hypothetical protein [Butyrivibrio sp. INlla16]SDB69215.1 pRiA4b ORF-3-like protein [Butyrivibrio sp. INlla16]
MEKMPDNDEVDELYQSIIDEYETTKSIAQIAKKLNTTQVRVQRVLITEGLWSSKRTKQIADLRQQGFSTEEIAEKLGKDVRTIQTFLPYTRGQYGKSDSTDALKSKEYRDRMHVAAENMRNKGEAAMTIERGIDIDYLMENGAQGEGNINIKPHTEEELERNPFLNNESVYRLKVELRDHFMWGENGLGLDADEERDFLKLAKAKEGISREVLVPSTMNLHAMHYMIQRLFGWQNGHLHNFCISKDEFQGITRGTVGGWKNLCGSLLHFPADDSTDFYWDDDYQEGESVKSWLKRKYEGPYFQKAVCETYFDSQRQVKKFSEDYPKFTSDMSLDEMNSKIIMEENLNFLNERLTLGELLTDKAPRAGKAREKAYAKWLERLDKKKKRIDEKIAGLGEQTVKDYIEAADNLKLWRHNRNNVEDRLYFGNADGLMDETGRTAEEWLDRADYMIPLYEDGCHRLFNEFNPRLTPLFDTLYYLYDYGDGWCVKITVMDKYDRKTNADLTTCKAFVIDIMNENDGLERYRYYNGDQAMDEELRSVLAYVDVKQHPKCVAADGLYVLDDVGGISGFYEMLETLAGDDLEEKAETRTWARSLGWTGRMSKPENML